MVLAAAERLPETLHFGDIYDLKGFDQVIGRRVFGWRRMTITYRPVGDELVVDEIWLHYTGERIGVFNGNRLMRP